MTSEAIPAANLLLVNAQVITLDPGLPRASLVTTQGEEIVFVGDASQRSSLTGPRTRVIDCQGGTLLPGFHDAHCHLLSLAAGHAGVDCSPPEVNSIASLQRAIAQRAQRTPPGQWIRAFGYHEFELAERRHPSRHDLDEAAPDHPVRLTHRSGHAHLLNSLGLRAVGITHDTPDPVSGVIERDERGEPTGMLLEMEEFLNGAVPPLPPQELRSALERVNQELVSCGITSVQDASAGNDLARWALFQKATQERLLLPHLTLMSGMQHLEEFHRDGLAFGAIQQGVRLGHAKIMLTLATGALFPPTDELARQMKQAAAWGFPVAIHAVEAEAVLAAAQALGTLRHSASGLRWRQRVEHASECPPVALSALRRAGVCVVTQPAFLDVHGDRYLQEVPPEARPWLYPIGSLINALSCVAASSDAPVGPLAPLRGMHAAVTRRTRSGQCLLPQEAIPIDEALALYTRNPAYVAGEEEHKGVISPGKLADMVLLDRDPTQASPEALLETKVRLVVVAGQVMEV